MTKACLALGLGLSLLAPIRATAKETRRDIVSVTFDSFKDMTDKKGRGLDGSVKFYFANEGGPKTPQEDLSARGSTFISHGDDLEACRMALVAAFVSFQERAKREGAKAVVDIRTYAEADVFSKSRDKCLCRMGNRSYTTVKGKLVKPLEVIE